MPKDVSRPTHPGRALDSSGEQPINIAPPMPVREGHRVFRCEDLSFSKLGLKNETPLLSELDIIHGAYLARLAPSTAVRGFNQ